MSEIPDTADSLFSDLLPLGILAYPEKIKEVNAIIAFKIVEKDITTKWTLDCTSVPPRILKGEGDKIPDSQVTVEMEHDDFKKLMKDANAGLDLYFQNKIRISGDSEKLMKLSLLFDVTRVYA